MDWITKQLCEPHHLILMFLVVIIVLVALGSGKGLDRILSIFKGKGDVTVINEGSSSHNKPVLCDPENCPAHQAERERSYRNQEDIRKLEAEMKLMKERFFAKLESIELGISDIKVTIAGLHR